ncbi:MAG TPA: peroxidase-related enzyme [Alloacidobacterium sp.]|nr:peroxidase-related enzyme [Alloacidobacterium sp.]
MTTSSIAQPPLFLAEVERSPKPSPYKDLLEAAKGSGGDSWQIWNLLAFDPELAHHLAAMSHVIMHKVSPISTGLRELIAAYTSSLNRCEFCMKAHAAVAAELLRDEALVWSVLHDLEKSALPENEKALLRFIGKVTLDSASIIQSDIEHLHAAGWQDDAIFYAISACALFNFYNRWVSASGVHPVSDDVVRRLASRMARSGYNRE